jgi:iron complex outermembrane receptor protein
MGQRSSDVFYPTLAMDSPKDDMDMAALSLNSKNLEARVYYSFVDHMMDNTSKSKYVTNPPTMKMEAPSDSRTYGGKLKVNLNFLDGTDAGMDYYNRWWDIA